MGPPLHRRTVLKGALAGLGAAVAGPALLRIRPAAADVPPSLVFELSGLDGGGGVNCLAISHDGRLVAGGDNNGPKVSSDGGRWTPAMGGLARRSLAPPASLAWDPFVPDRVWMSSGSPSSAEPHGLFVSTNGGLDWARCSSLPAVAPGSNRPRIVGRIIATPVPGLVFLGDAKGDVWRWSGFGDDGRDGTMTRIASFAGEAVTSLVADPLVEGRLYVATRVRCRQVDDADHADPDGAAVRQMAGTNAPGRTEELAAVVAPTGEVLLYAACWTNGVRRFAASGDPLASWSLVTPQGGSTQWCAVDAVRAGDEVVVAAGAASPARLATSGFDPVTGASFGSVFLSQDAGSGWIAVCSGVEGEGRIVNETGGPGGPAWWGYLPADAGGLSDNRLGAATFIPEQLVIDPVDASRVFAAGTQGIFRFDRGAATWYPAMRGLGVATSTVVRCDPNRAGRVIVGNIDHLVFVSDDGLVTARKNERPASLPENVFSIALDTGATPSRIYMGVGADGNANGSVVYASSPTAVWRSLGRPAGTAQRPLGLAVRRVSSEVVVLAAVEGKGVYRRRFDTADPPKALSNWTRVNGVAMKNKQSGDESPMSWTHASVAYLFDRTSGLWRSRDAGVSWQRIWSVKDNADMEGFVAADPDDPTGGTVLVSMGVRGSAPGLWRLRGCHIGGATVENGQIARQALERSAGMPFSTPGVLAVRGQGRLWVYEESEPALYASSDGGVTWSTSAGATFDRMAKKVAGIDVAPDGTVYLSLKGPGVAVGRSA